MECIYSILFKYQTLVSGVVGFLGIILTLLFNGKMQREQRLEIRKAEKDAIIAAVCAELAVNKDVIQGVITSFQDKKDSPGYCHMVSKRILNDVYKTNLNKIGLLSTKQSRSIISVYLAIERINDDLLTVSHWSKSKLYDDFISIPTGKWASQAVNQIEPYITEIDNALTALK